MQQNLNLSTFGEKKFEVFLLFRPPYYDVFCSLFMRQDKFDKSFLKTSFYKMILLSFLTSILGNTIFSLSFVGQMCYKNLGSLGPPKWTKTSPLLAEEIQCFLFFYEMGVFPVPTLQLLVAYLRYPSANFGRKNFDISATKCNLFLAFLHEK